MSVCRLGWIAVVGAATLGACVAPETPEPARRPQAAASAALPKRTDLEAAPVPNRRVIGPNSSIIQGDALKR